MEPAVRTDSDDEESRLQAPRSAREARAPGGRQAPPWVLWCLVFPAIGGCLGVICATWRLGVGTETSHVDDWQEKQALQQELTSQGGTLEAGPGCPSVCGSFVACNLNVSSQNNLLPLELAQINGFFPFNPNFARIVALQRLFNKQITPFVPEFQCPDTECFIPRAFLDDDFCDCPLTCADESGHSCDSCGVEFTGLDAAGEPGAGSCPSVCGALNANDISCLGAGTGEIFQCPDTLCQISASFRNDNRCDCPGSCADEDFWDCSNCTCPTICGVSVFQCDESGVFSCPVTQNNQSCNLPGRLQNDGVCDCPETCEDETGFFFPLDCDFCRCPTACGQDIAAVDDCLAEDSYLNFPQFLCPGGCPIPIYYQDDGYCDCPGTCADEPAWDCSTCFCPDRCGEFGHFCGDIYFQCPTTNCTIPIYYINDNQCDCPDCGDEDFWTCETCTFGCAAFCGRSFACDLRVFQCPGADCELLGFQVNDNRCDCPNCEDEEFWTCDTCATGCPSFCGEFSDAPFTVCGISPNQQLQCPEGSCPINSSQFFDGVCDCPEYCVDENRLCQETCSKAADPTFTALVSLDNICPSACNSGPLRNCTFRCPVVENSDYDYGYGYGLGFFGYGYGGFGALGGRKEGCLLEGYKVNDGVCDCPGTCADEDSWDCNSCPCPEQCFLGIREEPLVCADQFRCPSGCFLPSSVLDDGFCDCPGDCADESQWSCDNCSCVSECGNGHSVGCEGQFRCPGPDGCVIAAEKLGDLFCDCLDCADEASEGLNFVECSATLPSACGEPGPEPCRFRCADGCLIPGNFEGDDFCDCANCEDEDQSKGFICNTNGGICQCAAFCGDFSIPQCTPPTNVPPPGTFVCQDGCPIDSDFLNDDICDCPQCDDEDSWDCSTCTCPTCGVFFQCAGGSNFAGGPPVVQAAAQSRRVMEVNASAAQSRRVMEVNASLGASHVVEVAVEVALEIRGALRRAHGDRGKPEEALRRELQAAFREDGGGQGIFEKIFSLGLRKQMLHVAVMGALGQLGSLPDEMRRSCDAIFVDGPSLKDARKVSHMAKSWSDDDADVSKEVAARAGRQPKSSKSETSNKPDAKMQPKSSNKPGGKKIGQDTGTPADFNPVQFIVDEMMRIAYEDKSHSLADLIARALRHERLNPARRLQDVSPPGRPDIGDVLIPEDAFLCPDIADCPLPRYFQNNRKCDCPVTCADEDAFDCGNCVPTVPFGFQGPTEQSTAIGVAVGVGLGVGIGVGLGVGLGLGSALAAFFAAGVVQFSVTNAEAFISSPAVQQGMTKAFARLAGLEGSLDAVKLNWACAADAISTLTKSRLRRLGEEVTVCFEIEGEDEKESLKLCEVLQDVDPRGAEEVMQEELEAAGATEEDQNFELISWSPEPNPRSFNPLEGKAEKTQSRTLPFDPGQFGPGQFRPPKPLGFRGGGIDFG